MPSVVPTQSDIQTVLRAVLLGFLPAGVEVIAGQVNRVPEPASPDFVVFWPLSRDRISTNVDSYVDTRFLGSIALTVLTVTSVTYGALVAGRQIFGVGITDGTLIVNQLTGPPGGAGTYTISKTQTVAPEVMAAGVAALLQPVKSNFQLDIHGPNSNENAQIISTVFRDDYGVRAFAAIRSDVVPLYADDPRQVPFINSEQQYETRWVVEAVLQANEVVTLPQQFAETLVAGLIEVDTTYQL